MNHDALRVTLADKFDNITSVLTDHATIGDEIWARFTGGREGTVWYYQQMADALRAQLPDSALVRRLEEAIADLGAAARIDPRPGIAAGGVVMAASRRRKGRVATQESLDPGPECLAVSDRVVERGQADRWA